MRTLFLALVLANILALAWHIWVDPDWQAPLAAPTADGLELFNPGSGSAASMPSTATSKPAGAAQFPLGAASGECLRLGPLPDDAALQQATAQLSAQGIVATPEARDGQVWLGHWVQIVGFDSVAVAERALKRLAAAGVPDAYLMQEDSRPIISLGVFRERDRADHVASTARALGFNVAVRARYRPVVQQWLSLRPPAGQTLDRSVLNLGRDRIVRVESAPCEPESGVEPGPQPPLP